MQKRFLRRDSMVNIQFASRSWASSELRVDVMPRPTPASEDANPAPIILTLRRRLVAFSKYMSLPP